MRIGDTVRLIRIPNHECSALRSEHVGFIGLVVADDRRDDMDRTAYTVAFKGLGSVYVTDDMVEVVEETPNWGSKS